jgi:hypothetical protein
LGAASLRRHTIDLSPANFFWGCCAAAPEKSSTNKPVFDTFGNIQAHPPLVPVPLDR